MFLELSISLKVRYLLHYWNSIYDGISDNDDDDEDKAFGIHAPT